MNPRERPGKRGLVFPPSWQGERYTAAEEEAQERLQEAEGERAPADDKVIVKRMAEAMADFDDDYYSLHYYQRLARVALTAAQKDRAA